MGEAEVAALVEQAVMDDILRVFDSQRAQAVFEESEARPTPQPLCVPISRFRQRRCGLTSSSSMVRGGSCCTACRRSTRTACCSTSP